MIRYIVIILALILSVGTARSQSTFHFEKSFSVTFPNGIANQVSYINVPAGLNLAGFITVTVSGGYNSQLNMGVLKKRIAIVKGSSGYFNQSVEVLDATGPLASQWHIGDYDNDNSRIPIYHLRSTGNQISVRVNGQLNSSTVAAQLQDLMGVTAPVVSEHTEVRQYKSIMQDRVGIGTATPTERLSVNGNIRAKEVKVEVANWPDYVFKEDYSLMPLAELETHIKTHGHLPGIPTAKEAEADGIGLAEMNRKLLEKVEELTLHLIEKDKIEARQEKYISEQDGRIRNQADRLVRLEKMITALVNDTH